jgi:hypothetical protein
VGSCSDSECGLGPGCRRGLLHDDCGLPNPEVGVEMNRVEKRRGQGAWG